MNNVVELFARPVPTDPVAIETIVATLRAENAELRSRLAEATLLADSDNLTPLANRRCLAREIERAAAQRRRHGTVASLLFADLNALKVINDSFGHAGGDAAIRHVAKILMRETRAGDLVARIGGDEFGMLLVHADERAAAIAAARIAGAVAADPVAIGGRLVTLGIAIGWTGIGANDDAEQVLDRADCAMYGDKSAQRSER